MMVERTKQSETDLENSSHIREITEYSKKKHENVN